MNGPPMYDGPRVPSLVRLASVGLALGESLREQVVFIGAAILPLLEEDRGLLGAPRPTKDVDAVVRTTRYAEKARIEEALRERGFRHDQSSAGHMDRWVAPDGTLFDLLACGQHTGGTGCEHDALAIETAESLNLPPIVRHASAVGYLLLKCGAFRDRGARSPLHSKDLADIVSLVATRPRIADELRSAPEEIRHFVRAHIRSLIDDRRAIFIIATHISDRDPLVENLEERVMTTLRAMTADTAH